ncbi:MAG: 50S ribosomal protein L27 [Candidatus Doudnabacteria bacterium]|nr:50S ribosomal protein L27 [Candidatus Doudnabacteria bacterium]
MAHKKAGGSTSLGRDSISKRLGVKIFGGQKVAVGNVVIRQRGTKYVPGKNVRLGKDDTIYALRTGTVNFQKKRIRNFTGQLKLKTIVNVV